MMQVTEYLTRRYATKAFDPSKKIEQSKVNELLASLRYSASSTNIQPWHFIVASTDEGKARLAKGAQGGYSYNEPKILNASHVVLFCSRTSIDEAHLAKILEAEEQAGRFEGAPQAKQGAHDTRVSYLNFHKYQQKDVPHWLEKQIYLNLGTLLYSASILEIDAVPLEGIDQVVLNQEFDLPAKDLTAVAAVALGYHADSDFNANLPKARLAAEDIFTLI